MKSIYLAVLLLLGLCCASAQTPLPNLGLLQLPYQYPHYEIPTNANWAIVDGLFSNGPCGVDGIHALTYSNSGPKKFGCTSALLLLNPATDQTITSSANQGLIFDSTRGSIHIWPNDPTFGVPIIRLNSKVTGDAAITWALNGVESFALYHHGGGPVLAISETDVGGNDILGIFAGSLFLGSAAVPSTFVNIGSPLGLRFSGGQDIGDVGLTASPANGYFSMQIVSPSFSGNWLLGNRSTAQTSGNVALSGWGSGAAVSSVSGYSQRAQFTVTAGSAPSLNPTIIVSFPNVSSANSICEARQVGGTGISADFTSGTPSTTTSGTLTWLQTPTNTATYIFAVDCRL